MTALFLFLPSSSTPNRRRAPLSSVPLPSHEPHADLNDALSQHASAPPPSPIHLHRTPRASRTSESLCSCSRPLDASERDHRPPPMFSAVYVASVPPLSHIPPPCLAQTLCRACSPSTMSSTSAPTTVATAADPARRSSQSISVPCASISDDMKDITATASNRQARASQIYTRKRPSPHGVHKSSSTKTPMLYPTSAYLSRKSHSSLKRTRESQREAQLAALRREGIFIEERGDSKIA